MEVIMKKMTIYEPAMCCSTGVCGPSPDKELMRVSSIIDKLSKNGASITRYNLSNATDEFVNNKTVNDILNEKGDSELPIVMVNDEIVISGRYPSNEEFYELLFLENNEKTEAIDEKKSCGCSSKSGCC